MPSKPHSNHSSTANARAANSRSPRFDHWSAYWASGALTSLPQDFALNYDGEVAAFWREQFSDLPSEPRVLDICTGNAPIALLAAQWAEQQDVSMHIAAVDAARPDAEQIARRGPDVARWLAAIELHAETPVEQLPFPDNSFDLLTSQYGLEYCDMEPAAAELQRVARPGSRLVVLSHAADSAMMAIMSQEADDYALLAESGLLRVLRSWSKGQLADPDLPRRLDPLLKRLAEAARRSQASPLLAHVVQSISGLQQLPPAQRRVQRQAVLGFVGQLEAGRARLDDMLRVNRKIAGDPPWDEPLAKVGFEREKTGELIYREQHPMGHYVIWRKH